MKKKISEKDQEDWKKFTDSKEKIFDKDQKSFKKKFLKLERTIDLHGYTLDDANIEIEKFIYKCFDQGVYKISIITGKGNRSNNINDPYLSKDLSLLKHSVPNYINSKKNLMNKISKINFESIENPSEGSFDIILKKKNG